ncbi:MAG: serine/threonine protein kinase [Magnetococcus sp. MYC-9]
MAPVPLAPYTRCTLLRQGANSLVYEGWDPVRGRRVVIKTLPPTQGGVDGDKMRDRLRSEARLLGTLHHPAVVALYDYQEMQGQPLLVLEWLPGQSLKEWLARGERMEETQRVRLLSQLLEAVDYLHTQGVLHRDLKPGNLQLLADGSLKVIDFGLARRKNGLHGEADGSTGTPGYMAPEQLMGQPLDRRSDLFSIGVILYEVLTGRQPFAGEQVSTVMQRVLTLAPVPPTRHDARLAMAWDALLDKALAKRPTDRFQDAESFRLAVQALHPPDG